MSDLTKRLRKAGHNFDLPTVSSAIERANRFEAEAHHIAQLSPRDFDSIVLRDRIEALEECLRRLVAWHGSVRRPILTLDIITDKARALLEEK